MFEVGDIVRYTLTRISFDKFPTGIVVRVDSDGQYCYIIWFESGRIDDFPTHISNLVKLNDRTLF